MENIELFDKHLTGDLSDSEATEFYSKLAIDENMRSEFKAFASVKSGIQKNINSFAPSAALKSTVFANAGFSGNTITPVPKSSNTGIWGSKFFTGALSAISGVVVTVLLLKTLGIGFSDNNTSSQNITEEMFEYPEYVVEMPAVETTEVKAPEIVYIDRFIPVEIISENNEKTIKIIDLADGSSLTNNMVIQNNLSQLDLIEKDYSPINISTKKMNLNTEMMGMTGWNVPSANIFPDKYSRLNNLNINLLYEISERFKAGLGFSQETFHTVYEGTEADGSIYKYYQQPNLSTFSLVGKYIPFEYKKIAPYLQAGIGFNQTGYVFSPSIGAELRLYPSLSFIFGLDYKLMGFTHQNQWYSAKKYGFRYGFSFNF